MYESCPKIEKNRKRWLHARLTGQDTGSSYWKNEPFLNNKHFGLYVVFSLNLAIATQVPSTPSTQIQFARLKL